MKNLNLTFVRMIVVFALSLISIPFYSQNMINENYQHKEENGYLVFFDESTPQSVIDSIMTQNNSYEVWQTKYSKIRYWKVLNFPFSINDSNNINNMDELFVSSLNDGIKENGDGTKIGSLSFNYKVQRLIPEYSIINKEDENNNMCQEIFPSIGQGNNPILIDIMDTGFDFNGYPYQYSIPSIAGSYNFVTGNDNADDDHGHGTHLTSIISRLSDNNSNHISLFESKTHNSEGIAKISDIILAIDKSIEHNANIINASWMFYDTDHDIKTPLQIAIETAGNHGILFVAAAGNSTNDNDNAELKAFPASYPCENILAVSSNSCDSTLSYFSNYGFERSDVCAFGENIPGYVLNGQMAEMSGTSQATAYVSAIAAIIGTYMNDFNPIEVKKYITDGAAYNSNLEGLLSSEGVVDVFSSLDLVGVTPIVYHSDNKEKNSSISNFVNVYPVPFSGNMTIEIPENENTTIEIFDEYGNVVIKREVSDNVEEISGMESLKNGTYYIRTGNEVIKVCKIN